MILYDGSLFTVSQGFIRGWRVKSKVTGATVIPPREIADKMGLAWPRVRRQANIPEQIRRDTEERLFYMFAKASSDPLGPEGQAFVSITPEDLAYSAFVSVMQAEAELRAKFAFEDAWAGSKHLLHDYRFKLGLLPDSSLISADAEKGTFGKSTPVEGTTYLSLLSDALKLAVAGTEQVERDVKRSICMAITRPERATMLVTLSPATVATKAKSGELFKIMSLDR